MTEYSLVRSRRKTIGIYINENATLEVRAPLKAPKAEIDRIVESKRAWINEHLALREQRLERKAAFRLDYGDRVLLLGREYLIRPGDGGKAVFDGECFRVPQQLSQDEIKCAVIAAYRQLAGPLLTSKVAAYAKQMGLRPAAVKISAAKTRWGSCSNRGSINFSWRLVMADEDAVDYVVVHELAHLRELNHSERFWELVGSVLPDYRARQKKLKELHKRLLNENWD